jgi:hypothetical protein
LGIRPGGGQQDRNEVRSIVGHELRVPSGQNAALSNGRIYTAGVLKKNRASRIPQAMLARRLPEMHGEGNV